MRQHLSIAPFEGLADVWDYPHLATDGMPDLPVKVLGLAAGEYDPPRFIVQYRNDRGGLALGYAVEIRPLVASPREIRPCAS